MLQAESAALESPEPYVDQRARQSVRLVVSEARNLDQTDWAEQQPATEGSRDPGTLRSSTNRALWYYSSFLLLVVRCSKARSP